MSQTPKLKGERKMWLCRGFPQCTDVSKIKGSPRVRKRHQQDMKTKVEHSQASFRSWELRPRIPQMSSQTDVEVSPNVRKSAKLRGITDY
jgi:hypothetical protein